MPVHPSFSTLACHGLPLIGAGTESFRVLARIPCGSAPPYGSVMERLPGVLAMGRGRMRVPATNAAVAVLGTCTLLAAILVPAYGGTVLEEPAQVAASIAIGILQVVLAVIVARAAPGNPAGGLLRAPGLLRGGRRAK